MGEVKFQFLNVEGWEQNMLPLNVTHRFQRKNIKKCSCMDDINYVSEKDIVFIFIQYYVLFMWGNSPAVNIIIFSSFLSQEG